MKIIDIGLALAMGGALFGAASQPAKPGPAAPAASQPGGEAGLRWRFVEHTPIRYDLTQTISIKSSDREQPTPPPIKVTGSIEVQPTSADRAMVLFRAERPMPTPPPATRPAEPAPQAETTGNCSCRRVKGAAEPAKPPPPPSPQEEGSAVLTGTFELGADGVLKTPPARPTGQTDVMLRDLLPLPAAPIAVGESSSTGELVDGVRGSFPMFGTRVVTYEKDQEIDGRRCAVLKARTQLQGSSTPEFKVEGTMELKSETTAYFDIEAGYFLRSAAHTWFQMNTARVEDGRRKAITVEQEQESSLRLVTP